MIPVTAQNTVKTAVFAPVPAELPDRLDDKADTLADRPSQLFPLTPAQVRNLLT